MNGYAVEAVSYQTVVKTEEMPNSPEKPGLLHRNVAPDQGPNQAPERPLSIAWISDELLAKTQRVWSKAYGRPVSSKEAVEILTNVKHMAETLLTAKRGGDTQ